MVDGNLDGKPSSNGLFVDLKVWSLKHQLRTGDVVGIGTREVALSYYKFSLHESGDMAEELCMVNGENMCTTHPEMSDRFAKSAKSAKKPDVVVGKDFIVFDS